MRSSLVPSSTHCHRPISRSVGLRDARPETSLVVEDIIALPRRQDCEEDSIATNRVRRSQLEHLKSEVSPVRPPAGWKSRLRRGLFSKIGGWFSHRADERICLVVDQLIDLNITVSTINERLNNQESAHETNADLIEMLIADADRIRDHLSALQSGFNRTTESIDLVTKNINHVATAVRELESLSPLVNDLAAEVRSHGDDIGSMTRDLVELQQDNRNITSHLYGLQRAYQTDHDHLNGIAADLAVTVDSLRRFEALWKDLQRDLAMLAEAVSTQSDD